MNASGRASTRRVQRVAPAVPSWRLPAKTRPGHAPERNAMQTWQTLRHWTPILMLHEVLPDDQAPLPPYAITRAGLRAILADFTRRGYTSGTLDEVRAPHRPKRLVLTFDDGTADFLEHALPILEEFKFSATLCIVADFVGKQRTW